MSRKLTKIMTNTPNQTKISIDPIKIVRPIRKYAKRKLDIENYLKTGLNAGQIAQKMNCQTAIVYYYMKKANNIDSKPNKLTVLERKIKNFMYKYRNKYLTKELVTGMIMANKQCKISGENINLDIDNYGIVLNKSSGLPNLYLKKYHLFAVCGIDKAIEIATNLLRANGYKIESPISQN